MCGVTPARILTVLLTCATLLDTPTPLLVPRDSPIARAMTTVLTAPAVHGCQAARTARMARVVPLMTLNANPLLALAIIIFRALHAMMTLTVDGVRVPPTALPSPLNVLFLSAAMLIVLCH